MQTYGRGFRTPTPGSTERTTPSGHLPLQVPDGFGPVRYGDLLLHFEPEYGALVVAVDDDPDHTDDLHDNPDMDDQVVGGKVLYYIGSDRLEGMWPGSGPRTRR